MGGNTIFFKLQKKKTMQKIVETFIEEQRQNVIRIFKGEKELVPMFALLTKKGKDNCVHICPIPRLDDDNKDFIRYKLLNAIKERLADDGHKLLCVNWNSEAWMYDASEKDLASVGGDYKKLPKKEILLLHFDTADENKTITYEIKRTMSVNDDGLEEEVDIELFESPGLSGSKNERGGRLNDLFNS